MPGLSWGSDDFIQALAGGWGLELPSSCQAAPGKESGRCFQGVEKPLKWDGEARA